MKKVVFSLFVAGALVFASCGGNPEAEKAAKEFCDCAKGKDQGELMGCMMDLMKAVEDHKDDKGFEDDLEVAVKDECPDIYKKIEDMK
jgi:hypothetical protein